MGAFDQITNQKRAVSILQRTLLADRVSHAWLFSGSSAAALEALALAFAQTLQCTGRAPDSADACMACRSCRQASDGNHPDILTWHHAKPKTFSVDEVRSLAADISIRPFESEHKIYIVPDAHLMRQEGQNALLKTLEEPPEYAVIILLTLSADAMLETVRSRCQMVELAAGDTEYDPALFQAAQDILLRIRSFDLPRIRAAVKELAPYKGQADSILELFAAWYRDILYCKASTDQDALLFPEHSGDLLRSAGDMSFTQVQSVLDSIRAAQQRLRANVNFDLSMELLLLCMQQEGTKQEATQQEGTQQEGI